MICKFAKTLFVLMCLTNRNASAFNLIINFKGAPEQSFKGTGLKWKPINPSGIACFYAGKTSYTDQDGQVMLAVPMPSLTKFDLVLGKDLTPQPIIDKTINHISVATDQIKHARLYHFESQEVEVTEGLELKDKSSIPDKSEKKDDKDKEKDKKEDEGPKKVKKNLWTITKGELPEDGRLKNNTVIVLIDSSDVVVPLSRFYTPAENQNISLPPFFMVERDKDVDKNVLESFNKATPKTAPMSAIHTLETKSTKEEFKGENKDTKIVIENVDESVQE